MGLSFCENLFLTVALVSFSFPFKKIMGKRNKATHKNAASYVCGWVWGGRVAVVQDGSTEIFQGGRSKPAKYQQKPGKAQKIALMDPTDTEEKTRENGQIHANVDQGRAT